MSDVAPSINSSRISSNESQSSTSPTLVNEWLSVEAAALRLGISSRSIARRIQGGQLESRVDANGRRSVLVCLPAPEAALPIAEPAPARDASKDMAKDMGKETGKETGKNGSIEPGQARELAQQAMTVVIRSHEETMLTARQEMFAARASSRRAWAAVAVLLVGASVTVGIVTHNLTAASALVRQSEQNADQAQAQVIHLTVERDQLRDQMVQARVKEAQEQGQLAAMTVKPTTMPSSVAQRFASVFFGE
jgi:hypothetical protein